MNLRRTLDYRQERLCKNSRTKEGHTFGEESHLTPLETLQSLFNKYLLTVSYMPDISTVTCDTYLSKIDHSNPKPSKTADLVPLMGRQRTGTVREVKGWVSVKRLRTVFGGC